MGAFDSLRHRNYRLLWTGAILSNVGTWMQAVALSWYVFLLTHSPFWVSFVTLANFLPTVLSPLAGVYTDQFDRKKLLVYAQTFMMIDAAALAVLVWAGRANLAVVLVLTFGMGLGFALNAPTWQAFVPSLVPPESMVNAIALNSAQFSVARVIGPAIGGALLGIAGAGLVFGINAVSFVAVLIALALIRAQSTGQAEHTGVRGLLFGGFSYVWRHPQIRTMITVIAVMSFFGSPVTALLPIYAANVYGRGASSYGMLAAALGLGSVFGALVLGRRGRVTPRLIGGAMVFVGIVLVFFASVHLFPAAVGFMVLYGGGFLTVVSGTNSTIQLAVDEAVRGRVISIWMFAFGAAYPIGSVLQGSLAEVWSAPAVTIVGGAVCVAAGVVMLLFTGRQAA